MMPEEPLRALIVDDEGPARRILHTLLVDYCTGVRVVGESDSLAGARQAIQSIRPDVVFLDIELGTGTAFDLLAQLGATPDLSVVFVTAYERFALRAWQVDAIDYLTKPVAIADLQRAVERARCRRVPPLAHGPVLIIAQEGAKHVVAERELVYAKAEGSYCTIHLVSGEHLWVSKKLGWLEQELQSPQVVRIHRSYMVNLSCVREVSGFDVHLQNGSVVPVGRSKKQWLLDRLKSHAAPN